MKIGIIVGSVRPVSQSQRVAQRIQALFGEHHPTVSVEMFMLSELDTPLWNEGKWSADSDITQQWQPTSIRLAACDGFVVISPEWAGMVPPHLKNFLLMCEAGELAHKPAFIVAVSSGTGGAYPVAELRMSGYKNNYIWWLPDHVILRKISSLFVEEDELSKSLLNRITYCLGFLVSSAQALKPVREQHQNLEAYRFGM